MARAIEGGKQEAFDYAFNRMTERFFLELCIFGSALSPTQDYNLLFHQYRRIRKLQEARR